MMESLRILLSENIQLCCERNQKLLILLSDSVADGGFLTHYFATDSLKEKHSLCMLAVAQPLTHYRSVAMKLGIDMNAKLLSKDMMFVDCFGASDGNQSYDSFSIDKSKTLKDLYTIVDSKVRTLVCARLETPICLIVDDLSVLLTLGIEVQEILLFVKHCFKLIQSQQVPGYLVVKVHNDSDIYDEDYELLHTHLLHMCHLYCLVKGLETGYIKDVHGELNIQKRDPNGTMPSGSHSKTIIHQFRLLEKGVHLFTKGMSKGII